MPGALLLWFAGVLCLAMAQGNLPAGCYESNYTSTHTRCDLTFLFCFNYVQLKSCVLRKCDRFVRAGECLYETAFQENQADCYKNCCGSDHFDEQQCDDYNQKSEQKQTSTTANLTIALSIIAALLLALVIFFVIRKLGCCDPRDPFLFIRFNVKWRKVPYEDVKCAVCHTYGSMLITPCNHHFHVSCFEESAQKMACPACQQPIRERIRIFCFLCREKAFKVKIGRISDIADAMIEGKALHIDQCPREPRSNQALKT